MLYVTDFISEHKKLAAFSFILTTLYVTGYPRYDFRTEYQDAANIPAGSGAIMLESVELTKENLETHVQVEAAQLDLDPNKIDVVFCSDLDNYYDPCPPFKIDYVGLVKKIEDREGNVKYKVFLNKQEGGANTRTLRHEFKHIDNEDLEVIPWLARQHPLTDEIFDDFWRQLKVDLYARYGWDI